jgi:soluble lytic murein transglycosylase
MYYKTPITGLGKNKPKFLFLFIAGIIILSILLIAGYVYIYNAFFHSDARFDSIIADVSKHYALDPMLVKAVVWQESNFNPNAVGSKGEIGLMQLMMKSSVVDWENYNKRKIADKGILFNPKLNIEIGTWYLARNRNYWINYKNCDALALAGYNAGYSNVKKWVPKNYKGSDVINLIQFPSTRKYVKSILKKYHSYQLNTKK